MPSLPDIIVTVLTPFAKLFSRPVWNHARVLLAGAILCHGPRTVVSALRIMGLGEDKRFEKYRRVLNRAKWYGLQGAKILFGLLIALLPPFPPILIGVDDTIERRKGLRIRDIGAWRDPVRSSEKYVVECLGPMSFSMVLLVPLPWSRRPWALPFLTISASSEKAAQKRGRRHKTVIDRTKIMVWMIARWCRGRRWFLTGDGVFASVSLGLAVQKKGGVDFSIAYGYATV
ncbi:MAG: transposase [Magnetococcales bacterium]|nr:transposase [Magnetococcales bacterium]